VLVLNLLLLKKTSTYLTIESCLYIKFIDLCRHDSAE
jgi:hypothetical protein